MIVDGDTLRQTFDVYQENMPVDGDLVESVRSRARADRRNRLATVGGVLCALLLVGGGTWLLETRSPTSTDAAGEPAGKAVGERLGLPPLAFPGDGCKQWAGYEHDWGYCLDGVVGNEVDLILLSQEIYGYEMTDARITYVETQLELRDYRRPVTDEEKAKAKELEAILDETRPQLDSLYEPMDIEDFPGLAGEDLADAAGLVPSKGIAHVGSGAWGVELGPVFYDLDGVSATERGGEEWASRLSERDLRTAVVPDVVG